MHTFVDNVPEPIHTYTSLTSKMHAWGLTKHDFKKMFTENERKNSCAETITLEIVITSN